MRPLPRLLRYAPKAREGTLKLHFYLESIGIGVVRNESLSALCAIIDKSIVWYGNINFFGYNTEENNVMRIVDASIANDLLDIICAEVDEGKPHICL